MQRTIEILLVIGILVNIIKGADLILRPHQQKWFQDKFESLVLWFDYAKPIDWFIKREGAKKIYISQALLLVTFLYGGFFLINSRSMKGGWSWWGILIILYFVIYGVGQVISIKSNQDSKGLNPELLTNKYDRRVIRWLFGSQSLRQRLSRHLIVSTLGFVATFWLYIILDIGRDPLNPPGSSLLIELVLVVQGVSIVIGFLLIVAGILSFSILVFSLLFLLSELMLKIIRGIAWRIAEYNKGAFAAIVLLATIVLGVIELYLKFHQLPPPQP